VEVQYQAWVLALRSNLTIKQCLVDTYIVLSINLVLYSIESGTCRGVTVTSRRPSRVEIVITWQKQLSHYLYFFSFSFSLGLTT